MTDEADWMEPIDKEILDVLQAPENFTPDHVAEQGVCRAPRAAYRCRELTKRGLLKKQMTGVYEITDRGERVLEGELDPTTLEADEE